MPEESSAKPAPAAASAAPAPVPAPAVSAKTANLTHNWSEVDPKAGGYYWGTGRRKKAVARVRIKAGTGEIKVNNKPLEEYFKLQVDQQAVVAPLMATDTRKRVDVFVNAHGGGTTGQAGAVVLGIARALTRASKDYVPMLRDGHYLTRDPRKVERKKYGRAGARRSFQFSKR